jgi:hypothetical protein
MENLFNNLQEPTGDIKVITEKEWLSLNLGGTIVLQKGNFSQSFTYWGTVSEMDFTDNNYVTIEDYDWDTHTTMLGNLKIDSISKLKTTLESSGLNTLSDSLNFDTEEIKKAIFSIIPNSKIVKNVFGKNFILWESLTDNERKIIRVKDAIKNYDKYFTNNPYKLKNLIVKEDGKLNNETIPTIEQLNERLNDLLLINIKPI